LTRCRADREAKQTEIAFWRRILRRGLTVAFQARRQLCEVGHERGCLDCLLGWCGLVSAILATIAVTVDRRMCIIDPVKGIDFHKVGCVVGSSITRSLCGGAWTRANSG
jgi:hypothetical protein